MHSLGYPESKTEIRDKNYYFFYVQRQNPVMFLKRKIVAVNMFWSFVPLFTYSTNCSLSALGPGLYMEAWKGKRPCPQLCHCLAGQTDKQKFNYDAV